MLKTNPLAMMIQNTRFVVLIVPLLSLVLFMNSLFVQLMNVSFWIHDNGWLHHVVSFEKIAFLGSGFVINHLCKFSILLFYLLLGLWLWDQTPAHSSNSVTSTSLAVSAEKPRIAAAQSNGKYFPLKKTTKIFLV